MRLRKPGLTHRFLVLGLAAAAPAALVLGLLVPGAVQATVHPQMSPVTVHSRSSPVTVHPRSSSVTDFVTFYGWVDNSPPGRAIAHPSSDEPVHTTPLFTPPTTCHGGSGA